MQGYIFFLLHAKPHALMLGECLHFFIWLSFVLFGDFFFSLLRRKTKNSVWGECSRVASLWYLYFRFFKAVFDIQLADFPLYSLPLFSKKAYVALDELL